MDLLDPASIRLAVEGAHGVFHLASPVTLEPAQDPEKELLEPAVKGTLNVLREAKGAGVGRVVLVSSQAAMVPNPSWPADKVIDEDCWADVELLKQLQLWYHVSKTLAEKAAWSFAEEEGLHLVVLNPGMVFGPTLTPSVTCSLQLMLLLLRGRRLDMDAYHIGCVDVRDVAHSLVVLYESPSAQGRHLCLESIERMVDLTDRLAELYPELPVHSHPWRSARAGTEEDPNAMRGRDWMPTAGGREAMHAPCRARGRAAHRGIPLRSSSAWNFFFFFFFEVNLELDYMGANSTRNRWQELIHWRGTSIAWELIRLEVGTTTGLQMAASTHERVADR
ncbi:unnamed protein product [Urochloa humidicola]